jgi:general secretion pathway protein J
MCTLAHHTVQKASPYRCAGFTLVEVLVAMMVMAILAVMAWQGVDGIVRARDASETRLEQSLRLNTVLAQWEQDLASVQETTSVPPLTYDGATLRLTRRTGTGLQVVAWSLKPGKKDRDWLRWASPTVTASRDLQDHWLQSQQFVGSEPGQLRTLGGISEWQVYFYQGNGWSNAQSSGDVAPPAAAGSAPARQVLPSGVRLVLSFAEGSGLNGTLTRDVALGPQWP